MPEIIDNGSWYESFINIPLVPYQLLFYSVKDPSLWVHIDVAWAGIALCCLENRSKLYLEEISIFAKSFCNNFHIVPTLGIIP